MKLVHADKELLLFTVFYKHSCECLQREHSGVSFIWILYWWLWVFSTQLQFSAVEMSCHKNWLFRNRLYKIHDINTIIICYETVNIFYYVHRQSSKCDTRHTTLFRGWHLVLRPRKWALPFPWFTKLPLINDVVCWLSISIF